ncbi:MAG: hypothetical protein HWQ41_00650 [Nostoc sp. NOS(2021)]|nr:hypothetical protein [Nostoc sp. NOS(2021)]
MSVAKSKFLRTLSHLLHVMAQNWNAIANFHVLFFSPTSVTRLGWLKLYISLLVDHLE